MVVLASITSATMLTMLHCKACDPACGVIKPWVCVNLMHTFGSNIVKNVGISCFSMCRPGTRMHSVCNTLEGHMMLIVLCTKSTKRGSACVTISQPGSFISPYHLKPDSEVFQMFVFILCDCCCEVVPSCFSSSCHTSARPANQSR